MKRSSLVALVCNAAFRARISIRLAVVLSALVIGPSMTLTRAQYCNPAVISYIVRDERGQVLGEAALKSVYEQLPKSIGDAQVSIGQTSFAVDGKTFYRTGSIDWPKGQKVGGLEFINAQTCSMRLAEATLTYHNKRMRLIFDLEITRTQPDRHPVIDSLPFQEGTFALRLSGWSHDPSKVTPSERWVRVKN